MTRGDSSKHRGFRVWVAAALISLQAVAAALGVWLIALVVAIGSGSGSFIQIGGSVAGGLVFGAIGLLVLIAGIVTARALVSRRNWSRPAAVLCEILWVGACVGVSGGLIALLVPCVASAVVVVGLVLIRS